VIKLNNNNNNIEAIDTCLTHLPQSGDRLQFLHSKFTATFLRLTQIKETLTEWNLWRHLFLLYVLLLRLRIKITTLCYSRCLLEIWTSQVLMYYIYPYLSDGLNGSFSRDALQSWWLGGPLRITSTCQSSTNPHGQTGSGVQHRGTNLYLVGHHIMSV
jgi:hypothetical protein